MHRSSVVCSAVVVLLGAPAVTYGQDAAEQSTNAPPAAQAGADASETDASGFGGLTFSSADDPIVVEADKLEFDYEKNRLVYTGAVHVVQGDLELRSTHLIVRFERAGEPKDAKLTRVVAQGDVVITQGERRASGERAVFDQAKRQIVLLGDPVLRDGPNEVQGDRLTVYLDEGRSVVESSPKKRVSAVLFPGQSGGEALLPEPAAGEGPSR